MHRSFKKYILPSLIASVLVVSGAYSVLAASFLDISPVPFNYSIALDGDKVAAVGNTVTSTITTTQNEGSVNRLVRVYVDSITNSSGQNVLNSTQGITYTAPSPLIPFNSNNGTQQLPFTVSAGAATDVYTVNVRTVSDPRPYVMASECQSDADDTFLDGVIYYTMSCFGTPNGALGGLTSRTFTGIAQPDFSITTNKTAAANDAKTRTSAYCDLRDDNIANQSDTVAVLGKNYVSGFEELIQIQTPPGNSFVFGGRSFWTCAKDLNAARDNYGVVKVTDYSLIVDKYRMILYGQSGVGVEKTASFKIKVGSDLAAIAPGSTDDTIVSAPTVVSNISISPGNGYVSFNTFIKNLGGSFTSPAVKVRLQKKDHGAPDSAYAFVPSTNVLTGGMNIISTGLQNQQIITLPITYDTTASDTNPAGYDFRYVIDTDNAIPEYNETNNYSAPVTVVITQTGPAFDFQLSNGGNKSISAGASVQNSITAELKTSPTQTLLLSVDSITNEAGASYMNTSNGFTPTLASTLIVPTQSTVLTAQSQNSTPAGVYTVSVSGTSIYGVECDVSIEAMFNPPWQATLGCFYRGKTYSTTVDSANSNTIRSALNAFVQNQICTSGSASSQRWSLVYQDSFVQGGRFVYACNSDLATAIKKTTSFTITVDPYNLVAEKGADVCSATDAYTKLTWTRDSNATQYRLYRYYIQNGVETETIIPVAQPVSGSSVTFYDPDSNVSNNTGLTSGDLYRYQVAAVVGGSVQSRSASKSAFPSTIITCSEPFDYSIGSADITLNRGATATFKVPATLISGVTTGAAFQITPSNSNITFTTPTSCSALPCATTIGVTAGTSAPIATNTFTITARTSTNILRTNTITIRVTDNKTPYPVTSLSVVGPCSGNGVTNKPVAVSFTTATPADPDADFVTYEYQRDNGSGYGTSIAIPTGTTALSLTWTSAGVKKVRVRGIDSKGAFSPWLEKTITVVDVCPVTNGLKAACLSGFESASTKAVWSGSASGGTAPYLYSWNGGTYSSTATFSTVIAAAGGTAVAPILSARDSVGAVVAADPACTDVTRSGSTDIHLNISGNNISVQRGTTGTTVVTVRSTDIPPVSDIANVIVGTPKSDGSGATVTSVKTDVTSYTCSALVPECTKTLTITTTASAALGTYTVPLKAISRDGDEFEGSFTVTVTNTPITGPVNLTTANGPVTCTSSSIIARWNVDSNASGYNLYRWNSDPLNKVRLNSSGPIAQPSSGSYITFTDNEVLPGDNYFYGVRSIIGGVEAIPSPYSSRTAPSPAVGSCTFSFAVSGNGVALRPGEKVNTTVKVKLVSGTSRPTTISLKPLVRTIGSTVSDPYVTAKINGSAYCAAITCTIPISIEASPSATLDEYYIPVEARTDQGDIDTGTILVTIAEIPYVPPTLNPTVFLQVDRGPALCSPLSSSVFLKWPATLGQNGGYNVYRWEPTVGLKERINQTPIMPIAADNMGIYTDKSVVQNTTYAYEVRGIVNGREQSVSPSASIIAPTAQGCAFNFTVSGRDVSINPGKEVITDATINLLAGASKPTTLELGLAVFRPNLATKDEITGSSISRAIHSIIGETARVEAADGVTAKIIDSVRCDSIPCTIKIQVTSSVNTSQGAFLIPLTARTDDGDITKGTLAVLVSTSGKNGCTFNCGVDALFTLGAAATPVTIIAGQTGSSQVSVYTVSPVGADKASSVAIGTALRADTNRPDTTLKATPTRFNCTHSSPACVEFVQISTDVNTLPGEYRIPLLAKTKTNETAQLYISVTVADNPTSDALPQIQMRAYLPRQSQPTAWSTNDSLSPRRTSYLAPVTLDIESRRVLASGSTEDFAGCYTTTAYGTGNWVLGADDALVPPNQVFTRKTVTVVGADTFKIHCFNTKLNRFVTGQLNINPVNDPVIIEF